MSVLHYDTPNAPPAQPLDLQTEAWEREILPRLPANLAAQARALGAFVRQRGVRSPSDLLRALLGYVLCAPSFRSLGAWSVLIGLADLSEAAWRKRLRRSQVWLLWLLGELLSPHQACQAFPSRRGKILLIDATTLGTPGGTGDDWRLHTAYDLVEGRLDQVVIGDRRSGEHLEHYAFEPGDIGVTDRNYGYRRSIAAAKSKGADVVVRIRTDAFPMETEEGTAFDTFGWLKAGKGNERQQGLYCRYGKLRYPVRLLARRLSEEDAKEARARAVRDANRHGRQVKGQTLYLAEWVLLVTTLDEREWSDEQVWRLYRARWQIELVFKRLKQQVDLDSLRVKHPVGVEAVICLHLIAWALQSAAAGELRQGLGELGACDVAPASSWRLSWLCVGALRACVTGWWSLTRLTECLPRLQRYLCDSPRHRRQQETGLRTWLRARFWDLQTAQPRAA